MGNMFIFIFQRRKIRLREVRNLFLSESDMRDPGFEPSHPDSRARKNDRGYKIVKEKERMEPERRRLYTEYFQRGEPDQDPEPNNLQRKHVLGRLKKGIGPLSPTRPSLLMLTSRSTATNYCCDGNTLGAVKMKGKSESEEWRCILAEMKSWRT